MQTVADADGTRHLATECYSKTLMTEADTKNRQVEGFVFEQRLCCTKVGRLIRAARPRRQDDGVNVRSNELVKRSWSKKRVRVGQYDDTLCDLAREFHVVSLCVVASGMIRGVQQGEQVEGIGVEMIYHEDARKLNRHVWQA